MAGRDDLARRLRTDAERRALAPATRYADEHDLATPPERAYLEALPDARSDVLRRLVRGLLRGAPDELPERIALDPADPDLPDGPFFSMFDAEQFVAPVDDPSSVARVALLPFPASDAALAAPVEADYGYGRRVLAEPLVLQAPDTRDQIEHPVDVVPLLRREGAFSDDEQADLIASELSESAANLALARLAEAVQADGVTASSVLAVNAGLRGADAPAALERAVIDGHPLHPGGKIRRGMTPTDGLAYAPEFAASIDLHFAAVRADRARETQVDDRSLTDRLYAAFPGLESAVERSLPDGRRREEYAVVPVHPWQYYHVLPERYERRRAEGVVVPIQEFSRPATPLLNLRTVVPYPTDGAARPPHCKLAIGVRTTNVERTVSPQAVHNGPRATELLGSIAEAEPLERVGILDEPAATCYYPPGSPHTEGDAYDDVRHLSALVRSNPRDHEFVGDDRTLVPAAALIADSPATGRPIVREAVDRFVDRAGAGSGADADGGAERARRFLAAYVDAVVPEQLRLLTKYGIALETHLQNSYVVLEDGRPAATLVRDFGGIRVDADRLADRGRSFDPYPDSDIDADGPRDLYRKLHYALFQNHLTELIVALVESTPVDADDCWAVVRDRCRETFDRLRAEDDVPRARVDADEAALFEPPATHKALVPMRLRGKRHEYVTSEVPNPLADR